MPIPPLGQIFEAWAGIAPAYIPFAEEGLTTWLPRLIYYHIVIDLEERQFFDGFFHPNLFQNQALGYDQVWNFL